MTDSNQPADPNRNAPNTPTRSLRWRIIPGTFLAIFTVIGSIGMPLELWNVVYYNVQYGWIRFDPRNPSLNRLAITPVNVLVWQCGCLGLLAAGISAYAWFHGRWRVAWIGTVAFFALMFMTKWLESL